MTNKDADLKLLEVLKRIGETPIDEMEVQGINEVYDRITNKTPGSNLDETPSTATGPEGEGSGRRALAGVGAFLFVLVIGLSAALILNRLPVGESTTTTLPENHPSTTPPSSVPTSLPAPPAAFLAPSQLVDGFRTAELVFLDGSTIELQWPESVDIMSGGVLPHASAIVRDGGDGREFNVFYQSVREAVAGFGEPTLVGVYDDGRGGQVELWRPEGWPEYDFLSFQFEQWAVLVLHPRRNDPATERDRSVWAESLTGTITPEGFLLLGNEPEVWLAPAGVGPSSLSMTLYGPNGRVALTPVRCDPNTAPSPVEQTPGYASWCDRGGQVFIQVDGPEGFPQTVHDNLVIVSTSILWPKIPASVVPPDLTGEGLIEVATLKLPLVPTNTPVGLAALGGSQVSVTLPDGFGVVAVTSHVAVQSGNGPDIGWASYPRGEGIFSFFGIPATLVDLVEVNGGRLAFYELDNIGTQTIALWQGNEYDLVSGSFRSLEEVLGFINTVQIDEGQSGATIRGDGWQVTYEDLVITLMVPGDSGRGDAILEILPVDSDRAVFGSGGERGRWGEFLLTGDAIDEGIVFRNSTAWASVTPGGVGAVDAFGAHEEELLDEVNIIWRAR